MESKDDGSLHRLKARCDESSFDNADAYLNKAVFGEFQGIVLIDEAKQELHMVLEKINASISVLEVKEYVNEDGDKEGLSAARAKGARLGRPRGPDKSKLDKFRPEIEAHFKEASEFAPVRILAMTSRLEIWRPCR